MSSMQFTYSFLGLPAYGEDRDIIDQLDAAPKGVLAEAHYRCGNDMICGWAGALAAQDGINVVAGTGSIAYGEYRGRRARAGGWGELIGDEASAHWVAREALNAFSRMSDSRMPKGVLHAALKKHFGVIHNLDMCAAIYGQGPTARSDIAKLAPVVAEAAGQGDVVARGIFVRGADELADMAVAVGQRLEAPPETPLTVSYSGSMFKLGDLVLEPFRTSLRKRAPHYLLAAPRLSPALGAALYAARLNGTPLSSAALAAIESDGSRQQLQS
jgi:N-acetylglucosamine kinase-like BadF-type ATPase